MQSDSGLIRQPAAAELRRRIDRRPAAFCTSPRSPRSVLRRCLIARRDRRDQLFAAMRLPTAILSSLNSASSVL